MLHVSIVLKIKMHVFWVLNITFLIPEDGQYSRNMQHGLTGLIKVVVVDCNKYRNFNCISQRDEFYKNYTASLLDETRSVDVGTMILRGKTEVLWKETVPMQLQPPQNTNRKTLDWTRVSAVRVRRRLSHGRGTANSRRHSLKVSVIFVGFSQNLMSKRSWYRNSKIWNFTKICGAKVTLFHENRRVLSMRSCDFLKTR